GSAEVEDVLVRRRALEVGDVGAGAGGGTVAAAALAVPRHGLDVWDAPPERLRGRVAAPALGRGPDAVRAGGDADVQRPRVERARTPPRVDDRDPEGGPLGARETDRVRRQGEDEVVV